MFSRKDINVSVTKALPAAAAAAQTDWIDLTNGGDIPIEIELEISAPATAALVDAKDIDYLIQESHDKSTVVTASWAPTMQQVGADGDGAAAVTQRIRPPSTARRYVRLQATVETGGGDNTGASFALNTYM